jgi:hypothetical protein
LGWIQLLASEAALSSIACDTLGDFDMALAVVVAAPEISCA